MYIRQKIADRNGKIDYSATEKVTLSCQQPHITMIANPVKNILLITNLSGINQIQVYNGFGGQVFSLQTINSQQLVDLTSVPGGVYIVRVITNNKVVTTKKIIKD